MGKSIIQVIYLCICVIITKLTVPNARIMRRPIDIRGKKGIAFGKKLTTGKYCRIETFSGNKKSLIFGNDIQINDFVHIAAKDSIRIDDGVLIASRVFITDLEHGSYKGNDDDSTPMERPKSRKLSTNSVHICENVWIGENVAILPGVTIGRGSIIGANSVVTKSIPDYVIAVGNPAKIIKTFNFKTNKWEKTC